MTIKDSFSEDGVRYLRGQDLTHFFISDANPVYIPQELYNGLSKRCHMKAGDILLSIVGTIGGVALVTDRYGSLTGSCKIAILRPRTISPYFLAAYLMSKVGQAQIQRRVRGAVQQGLILPDLNLLPVPTVDNEEQQKVEILMNQAYQKYRESESLYVEGQALLAAELGLDKLDLSESLYSVRHFSEVTKARRADAEYFQEKYYRLNTAIQQSTHRTLGRLIEPVRNGFDYRGFVEEGTPYVRVGDVRIGRIDLDGAARVPLTVAEVQKDISLRVGDVLFTRKGTYGCTAVVRSGQESVIISSEIMLLRLRRDLDVPLLPDYLALFLNSDLGYQQVKRRVHGVAYYSISQPDLADVSVVVPSLAIQERLADYVQTSLSAERASRRLLAEAKAEVERMIEQASATGG